MRNLQLELESEFPFLFFVLVFFLDYEARLSISEIRILDRSLQNMFLCIIVCAIASKKYVVAYAVFFGSR
jgi:hypothetical protein